MRTAIPDRGNAILPEGCVDFRSVLASSPALHRVKHTHDLPLNCWAILGLTSQLLHHHTLLERIDPFQKSTDKGLIDHSYPEARRIISIGKGSSLYDSNSKGLEIVGGNRLKIRVRAQRRIRIRGSTGNGERHFGVHAIERQITHRDTCETPGTASMLARIRR